MKIRSITDVITNSSTEVFAMIDRGSVDILKRMINLLLKAGGSKVSCDDLFDIHLELSDWVGEDDYEGLKKEGDKEWGDMTDQEKIDWCLSHTEEGYRSYMYPNVVVTPKISGIPQELIDLLERAVDTGLTPVDATFG